jgi:hypothetical protein
MKVRFLHMLLLLVFICFSAGCIRQIDPVVSPRAKLTSADTYEYIRATMRSGDWLLSIDKDAPADAPIFRVGIFDAATGEVIQGDISGVRVIRIKNLLAQSRRLLVIQPAWATDVSVPKALAHARSLVGTKPVIVNTSPEQQHFNTSFAAEVYRPFSTVWTNGNLIPTVVTINDLYRWGRVIFDLGS